MFSSMGFYPVAPGSDEYSLGSPSVKSARLNLENGKTFLIEAINQSDRHVYVQKVLLNGTQLTTPVLHHDQIMKGGKLTFYMSDRPLGK